MRWTLTLQSGLNAKRLALYMVSFPTIMGGKSYQNSPVFGSYRRTKACQFSRTSAHGQLFRTEWWIVRGFTDIWQCPVCSPVVFVTLQLPRCPRRTTGVSGGKSGTRSRVGGTADSGWAPTPRSTDGKWEAEERNVKPQGNPERCSPSETLHCLNILVIYVTSYLKGYLIRAEHKVQCLLPLFRGRFYMACSYIRVQLSLMGCQDKEEKIEQTNWASNHTVF